jgi:hypothetical protein
MTKDELLAALAKIPGNPEVHILVGEDLVGTIEAEWDEPDHGLLTLRLRSPLAAAEPDPTADKPPVTPTRQTLHGLDSLRQHLETARRRAGSRG